METKRKNFSINFSVDLPPNTIREYMNGLAKIEKEKRRNRFASKQNNTKFIDILMQCLKIFLETYSQEFCHSKGIFSNQEKRESVYPNKEKGGHFLGGLIEQYCGKDSKTSTKYKDLLSGFVKSDGTTITPENKSITTMLLEIYDDYVAHLGNQDASDFLTPKKENLESNVVEESTPKGSSSSTPKGSSSSTPKGSSSSNQKDYLEKNDTPAEKSLPKNVDTITPESPVLDTPVSPVIEKPTLPSPPNIDINECVQKMFGIKPEDLPPEFQKNEMIKEFQNNDMFKTLMPMLSGFLGGFANQMNKGEVQVPVPIPPKAQTSDVSTKIVKRKSKIIDVSEIIKNEQERVCEDTDNGSYSKEDVDLIIKGGYSE